MTQSVYLTPSTVDTNWEIAGVGDFNADGRPDILWRNKATGMLGVWMMNGTTMTQSLYLTPSTVDTNWEIAGVGDFNADGRPDILWRNKATGMLGVWMMNGTTMTQSLYLTPSTVDTNWKIVGPK
jgi:hypothetical protein